MCVVLQHPLPSFAFVVVVVVVVIATDAAAVVVGQTN